MKGPLFIGMCAVTNLLSAIPPASELACTVKDRLALMRAFFQSCSVDSVILVG